MSWWEVNVIQSDVAWCDSSLYLQHDRMEQVFIYLSFVFAANRLSSRQDRSYYLSNYGHVCFIPSWMRRYSLANMCPSKATVLKETS